MRFRELQIAPLLTANLNHRSRHAQMSTKLAGSSTKGAWCIAWIAYGASTQRFMLHPQGITQVNSGLEQMFVNQTSALRIKLRDTTHASKGLEDGIRPYAYLYTVITQLTATAL